MVLRSSMDAWTWTLIAAVVGGGCGGSTDDDPAGTGGAGVGGGSGGSAAVSGSGGVAGSGGSGGSAAVSGSGGTGPRFECLNPTPVLDASGRETGFIACGDSMSQAGSYRHRERAVDCSAVLSESPSCAMVGGGCMANAECTERPYGFCRPFPAGGIGCGCEYGCVRDTDCAAGQICDCTGSVGVCVPSSCTTDADCGDGYCASYQIQPYCGGTGYACQMPVDECMTDADCAGKPCAFDGTRRVCQPGACVPGRPFLIDGAARTAPALARADWRDAGRAPETSALTADERAALAAHWLDAALLEHASVAAFARFVLQLLELGAPPELVNGAQAAIADETRHAQLCFQLASVYGGRVVGPGPLSLDGALEGGRDVKSLLTLVIREGCIGETLAALEAREALEHATDPAVRAALDRIQADETRHAALAWRFVRWVLGRTPELGAHVAEVFAFEARRSREEEPAPASHGLELSGHGVLPARIRRTLRCDAHACVIPALLDETLGLAPERRFSFAG